MLNYYLDHLLILNHVHLIQISYPIEIKIEFLIYIINFYKHQLDLNGHVDDLIFVEDYVIKQVMMELIVHVVVHHDHK